MTDIEVIINTDNAAFDESPSEEIHRLLSVAAHIIDIHKTGEHNLLDINGNTVGFVRITD